METGEYPSRSSTLVNSHGEAAAEFGAQLQSKSWVTHVHPRGWIYFRNTALKAVTDQDVRDPETLRLVERGLSDYPIGALEDGMEVHLYHVHAQDEGSSTVLGQFNMAINHRSCLASYTLDQVLPENVQKLGPSQLNRCRRFYWNYLWNHPSHTETPERAIKDALDALTWFYTDHLIIGQHCNIPFSKAECAELASVVRELAGPQNDGSSAKTMFLAWFLREVTSFRASESHGTLTGRQTDARRHERIAEGLPKHKQLSPVPLFCLNLVINFLFFGIPRTYLTHIQATSEFRGRLTDVQHKWQGYIERLVREYTHFLLIATVLLSATIGFMSIDNLSEAARLAAAISALLSMSSIIIGVFSVWRHQANTSRRHSYTYMHNVQQSFLGLPGHAILLGLPPSLLVWAILGFTVAIVTYIVEDLANPDVLSKISAWVLLGVFVVLLGIVLSALYTFSIIWTFQPRTSPTFRDLRAKIPNFSILFRTMGPSFPPSKV